MDIVDELTDLSGAPANEVKAVADKAIKEIERLRDLGLTMRNAQKKYFKERTQENLIASKQAEKAFDDALKEGE